MNTVDTEQRRITPDEFDLRGLTHSEVQQAHHRGDTNYVRRRSSRPIKTIIRANVFTLFNAILTAAVVVVLFVGSWKDAVFGIVMVTNALIGIVSEIRAKRTLDALSILEAPRSTVLRDGREEDIASSDIVRNDLVVLSQGDQVPADGDVVFSRSLKIDESMLTGESHAVRKRENDHALSGTTVVAGTGVMRATAIGSDSYAQQLTQQAKKYSKARSEIADGIDVVLKWISWVIIPVVALLVWSQLQTGEGTSWKGAVVLAVAGVVGMIPQGLVLLTSLNFALAAAGLARKKVLIQELNAVEVLARVDRLCLDKTGTLTSGEITAREILELSAMKNVDCDYAKSVLFALVADGENETALATKRALGKRQPAPLNTAVPFDSTRKWSAAETDHGTWFFGAPEIITQSATNADEVADRVHELAKTGARVICLAHSDTKSLDPDHPEIPSDTAAVLLVILEEEVRSDAAETMEYFLRQGVVVKVISGDNPTTVGAIAERVGVRRGGDVRIMDARELPDDPQQLAQIVENYDVFGRVTPEVKRAMVHALQSRGHTVAMTGDGVNDVLALKDSDLGIAMGSGARATKAVAKVVLIDGQFALLPRVVAEGRRIIANMERVSALFLTKTFYSFLLAIIVASIAWRYPFLPRHLTIIGSLTIGIPAFFLALAPNHRRYRPGFLSRTLFLALPAGLTLAVVALVAQRLYAQSPTTASTIATLTVVGGGIYLLSILSRPIVMWRAILLTVMATLAVLIVLVPALRHFFALVWPTPTQWLVVGALSALTWVILETVYRYHQYRFGNATRLVTSLDNDSATT
ncbi:MAG: cation-translocating P-type ATPase [Actinomycetaceae bacterium]|nr:cation-translocating P-type ATPase [Actinomycetaceae bacterium]